MNNLATCEVEQGRKSRFKSLMQGTVIPLRDSKKHFKINLPAEDLFQSPFAES